MMNLDKKFSQYFLVVAALFAASIAANSQTVGDICPDPAKPCHHKEKKFDEWELPFKMPVRVVANKEYKSVKFYAVLLKEFGLDSDCGDNDYLEAAETERKALQAKYPKLKVFGSYMCPNLSGVGYDFEGKWDKVNDVVLIDNFIAIYAGSTKADADKLLTELKAKFPDAVVKQMTASYESLSF